MNQLRRFLAPTVFFGTTLYVASVNTGNERRIVFPLLDRISPDPNTQGQLTLAILIALGLGTLALALSRGRNQEEPD